MRSSDLALQLKGAVENGLYRPGERLPSARALAHAHGVSYLTASRALDRLAEEGIIRRVPRSGSFVTGKQGTFHVGFSDAHFNNPSLDLVAGYLRQQILEEFRKRNCKIRMLSREDFRDPEWLSELDLILVAHGIDGTLRKELTRLPVPIVLFRSEHIQDLPFHQVTIDLDPGFAELFRQVTPERFPRLFILTEGHAASHLRRDAALRHAREAGFPDDRIECIDNSGPAQWKGLAARCRGTLLFTCGDMLAAGVIGTLLAEGIVVGRDVMLAGYDNLESCGYLPFGKPVISAVGYDRKEAAGTIARLAERLLKEPDTAKFRNIISIPTQFKNRQTL